MRVTTQRGLTTHLMEAPISPPLTFDAFQSLSADAARPLYDAAQTTSAHHVRFVLSTAREHASRVRQGSIGFGK